MSICFIGKKPIVSASNNAKDTEVGGPENTKEATSNPRPTPVQEVQHGTPLDQTAMLGKFWEVGGFGLEEISQKR